MPNSNYQNKFTVGELGSTKSQTSYISLSMKTMDMRVLDNRAQALDQSIQRGHEVGAPVVGLMPS